MYFYATSNVVNLPILLFPQLHCMKKQRFYFHQYQCSRFASERALAPTMLSGNYHLNTSAMEMPQLLS